MATKKAKYPQTIYVRWDGEESDPYLSADEHASNHAAVNETRDVAIYELKRVARITARPELD